MLPPFSVNHSYAISLTISIAVIHRLAELAYRRRNGCQSESVCIVCVEAHLLACATVVYRSINAASLEFKF